MFKKVVESIKKTNPDYVYKESDFMVISDKSGTYIDSWNLKSKQPSIEKLNMMEDIPDNSHKCCVNHELCLKIEKLQTQIDGLIIQVNNLIDVNKV